MKKTTPESSPPIPVFPRHLRHPLLLILLTRLAVGLAFTVIVPPWEADNEESHFAYARYLARHNTLTLNPADPDAADIWEKFQPPLYYNLVALALRGFDLSDDYRPTAYPYLANGDVGIVRAVPLVNPTPGQQQIIWALYAGRLMSGLLSASGVVWMWLLTRRLWPRRPALVGLATLTYAFWPQHLFVGSVISNDALLIALCAMTLYGVVELLTTGFHWRFALLATLGVMAALLTKVNALSLLPLVGLAIVISFSRARHFRWWQGPLALGVIGLALAATFNALTSLAFVSQHVLRGDTLTRFAQFAFAPENGALLTQASAFGYRTFFASFGWGNVEIFEWAYRMWNMAGALAVLGWGVGLGRWLSARPAHTPHKLLCALLALLIGLGWALPAALVVASRNPFVFTGRYMLTTLPALACLLALGWQAVLLNPWRVWVLRLFAIGGVVLGWAIPGFAVTPLYAQPYLLNKADASYDVPLRVVYQDQIELLGYRSLGAVYPGEEVALTLCWQAVAPIPQHYTLQLTVVGADGQGYGQTRTYPGAGQYPTGNWAVRQPFCETYRVRVTPNYPAPSVGAISVMWLEGEAGPELAARNEAETLSTPEAIVPLVVHSRAPAPRLETPVRYYFGENIWLTSYAFTPTPEGDGGRVDLRWETTRALPNDYVVFVHLRDTPTNAVGVGDSEPLNGAYPTHWWLPGESLIDSHWVRLTAGYATPTPVLKIYVGLYHRVTLERLPAYNAQGERQRNDEVILPGDLILGPPP
jgi:4-amino-4-deoxy-L-arabinose transferase-like glycosyltransferase